MNGHVVARDSMLELTVTLSPPREHLRLAYQARAAEPVLVFDGLQRMSHDGTEKYDRTLAYFSFNPPACLSVLRIRPRLPKLKNVLYGRSPWAHRVDRGVTLTGEVITPIPVAECSPYYPPGESAVYRSGEADRLRLILQYVPVSQDLKITAVKYTTDLYDVESAVRKKLDLRLLEAELPLSNPLPVKIRSDRFERVIA